MPNPIAPEMSSIVGTSGVAVSTSTIVSTIAVAMFHSHMALKHVPKVLVQACPIVEWSIVIAVPAPRMSSSSLAPQLVSLLLLVHPRIKKVRTKGSCHSGHEESGSPFGFRFITFRWSVGLEGGREVVDVHSSQVGFAVELVFALVAVRSMRQCPAGTRRTPIELLSVDELDLFFLSLVGLESPHRR